MTADVRDRLRQLTEAHGQATAGEWEQDGEYPTEVYNGLCGDKERLIAECHLAEREARDNAAAIVAAHNAVPWLVAALTAVLDLADELDGEAKGLRDQALDLRRYRYPDAARLRDEEATDLANRADRIRAVVAAAGGEGE
jgi:hypothetical protein